MHCPEPATHAPDGHAGHASRDRRRRRHGHRRGHDPTDQPDHPAGQTGPSDAGPPTPFGSQSARSAGPHPCPGSRSRNGHNSRQHPPADDQEKADGERPSDHRRRSPPPPSDHRRHETPERTGHGNERHGDRDRSEPGRLRRPSPTRASADAAGPRTLTASRAGLLAGPTSAAGDIAPAPSLPAGPSAGTTDWSAAQLIFAHYDLQGTRQEPRGGGQVPVRLYGSDRAGMPAGHALGSQE